MSCNESDRYGEKLIDRSADRNRWSVYMRQIIVDYVDALISTRGQTRAFRRLEYKTQVFLNGTGDHLRTRLTHSIEVASISRTIARALSLNEDLAEAITLAHDLGRHC
jgi:HD domain-containing protein